MRFNYDVSPPPPPPQRLPLYDKLIDQDPRGFQMAQTLLADIFPRLEHVATSSVGATVGEYIADFEITKYALTKAFLSSRHLTPNGIAARVTEPKHTGRWRPACLEIQQVSKRPKRCGCWNRIQSAHKQSKFRPVAHNNPSLFAHSLSLLTPTASRHAPTSASRITT